MILHKEIKTMLVSVIMPTYNNPEILRYSLPAILDQKISPGFDYELVLVDDGSNSSTKKFLAAFKNSRLKLLTLEQNSGRSIARNRGLSRAKGEVIVFLDSDVIADKNLVEEHCKSLELNSQTKTPKPLVSSGRLINFHNFSDLEKAEYKLSDFSAAHFATGNCAVHRSFLEKAQENSKGPFDEENFSVYGWEDLELGIRLGFLGIRYVSSGKAFGYHHCPPFDLEKIPVYLKKEVERAHTANRFYHKHPSLNVRLMTQKTLLHRLLWELLTLGGLLNERTLRPLMSYFLKKKKYGLVEVLARNTFLNLTYVRHL